VLTQAMYNAREFAMTQMRPRERHGRRQEPRLGRLAAEHQLPETSPKPTFILGLDD
jgi:hypothetical protein